MNYFALCKHCQGFVIETNRHFYCPTCTKTIDQKDILVDEFSQFIDDYKAKTYFDWEDIQRLIHYVDYLTEINNRVCMDLAQSLKELYKLRERLGWYRDRTFKEIK